MLHKLTFDNARSDKVKILLFWFNGSRFANNTFALSLANHLLGMNLVDLFY